MTSTTLIELLSRRAHHEPDRRAYTFLSDGEVEGASLTYAEMERRGRAIAALLQSCATRGDRALLLYPPGLEFICAFFGCVFSGIIAVPVPLPRSNQSLNQRISSIIKDSSPTVALTTSRTLSTLGKVDQTAPQWGSIRWFSTDDIAEDLGNEWQDPGVGGNELAMLQYTSGSTATPKGVMTSHQNILHNCAEIDRGCEHTPASVGVTWLPHFHDMGLIYGIIQPLYNGFPCFILPPMYVLQRPFRWLEAISRYRGTHSTAPNFAYDLCVSKVFPDRRPTLDLSHWRFAGVGAEPVRKQTLDRFSEAFAPSGFREQALCPAYGMAETTLKISASHVGESLVFGTFEAAALAQGRIVNASEDDRSAQTLVGCGSPAPGVRVVIVDPESSTQCAPDRVGEIWLSSASVAQGYWNRPVETEWAFRAYLADSGEGPFLRTGDLGFVRDGELFITGRLKDLIIVAGRNLYPQDVERSIEECHPALRRSCSAAFSVEVNAEERLVIVAEVEPRYRPDPGIGTDNHNETEPQGTPATDHQGDGRPDRYPGHRPSVDAGLLIRAVRKVVAEEYEAQAYAVLLLKPGSLPKTSSGKVQRHVCRNRFQAGNLELWGE